MQPASDDRSLFEPSNLCATLVMWDLKMAHHRQGVNKRLAARAAQEQNEPSVLAALLLQKWAWGELSAKTTKHLGVMGWERLVMYLWPPVQIHVASRTFMKFLASSCGG